MSCHSSTSGPCRRRLLWYLHFYGPGTIVLQVATRGEGLPLLHEFMAIRAVVFRSGLSPETVESVSFTPSGIELSSLNAD